MSKQENGFVRVLKNIIPVIQDSPREWVRKLAFLMALLLFIGSGYYLLDELWWKPQHTQDTVNTLREYFHDDDTQQSSDGEEGSDTTVYPAGMNESFKRLYRLNPDIRGWLTFKTEGEDLFEGAIDNPVVQTTDNDYYLNHDFYGEEDKAGTLFFDSRNNLSAGGENRNLHIYGHNLTSGLMFSKFNQLVKPNLSRGKRLTTLTLNTLFEERTYKVIAVMIVNVNESEGPVFAYTRTKFSSEKDFLSFVNEIRRRSIYDYNDVDVQEGDELLTMTSCTNRRESRLKDGRVVVVARRVREGEDPTVDSSKTTLNEDVLMPKAWYTAQGFSVPDEYKETLPTSKTTTTATTAMTTVVTTTTQSTDTTVVTDQSDITTTTTGVTAVTTTLPSTTVSSTTTTQGTVTTTPATTVVTTTTVPTTVTTTTAATTVTTATVPTTTVTTTATTTVPTTTATTVAATTTATTVAATTTVPTTVTTTEPTTVTTTAAE